MHDKRTQTHTHAHIHTQTRAHTNTRTLSHMHAHTHALSETDALSHRHAYTHMRTQMYAHVLVVEVLLLGIHSLNFLLLVGISAADGDPSLQMKVLVPTNHLWV